MCLTISGKFNKKSSDTLFVSQKRDYDIKVYKALQFIKGKSFATPFRGLDIDFDEDGKKVLEADHFYHHAASTVTHGIHAFYSRERAKEYADDSFKCGCLEILFPAIIPAGTEFYIGDDGDIVAEKIIIFGTTISWNRYTTSNFPFIVYRTDDGIPEEVPGYTDKEISDEFPR